MAEYRVCGAIRLRGYHPDLNRGLAILNRHITLDLSTADRPWPGRSVDLQTTVNFHVGANIEGGRLQNLSRIAEEVRRWAEVEAATSHREVAVNGAVEEDGPTGDRQSSLDLAGAHKIAGLAGRYSHIGPGNDAAAHAGTAAGTVVAALQICSPFLPPIGV